MNNVDAITSKRDINKMKKALAAGRDKLLFTLGINSLLRISDLLQLKVSDVINADGTPKGNLVIVEKKTKKKRYITLNASIKKELKQLNVKDHDAFLFPSRKGGGSKAISRVQAYRILNAAAERAGLDDLQIGTHTLRKTGGRFMYEQGVSLPLIMQLLNHTSEAVSLRYIGITKDQISEAYVNLNL